MQHELCIGIEFEIVLTLLLHELQARELGKVAGFAAV